MFAQVIIRRALVCAVVIAVALPLSVASASAAPQTRLIPAHTRCRLVTYFKRNRFCREIVDAGRRRHGATASYTTAQANAMQARAVAHGQANSTLSNPAIEQLVTTPESTGKNSTKIPSGGF